MDNLQQTKEELIKKLQHCLSEVGLKPEVEVSSCGAVVAARQEIQGEMLRVVAQITTRDVQPLNQGGVNLEIARDRLMSIMVRPTLAAQVATKAPDIKDSCNSGSNQPC